MTQSTNTDIANLLQKMDSKIDAISSDLSDLKIGQAMLEERSAGFEAKTLEQFDAANQRLGSLEERTQTQDGHIWSLLAGLLLTVVGLSTKVAFFPGPQT